MHDRAPKSLFAVFLACLHVPFLALHFHGEALFILLDTYAYRTLLESTEAPGHHFMFSPLLKASLPYPPPLSTAEPNPGNNTWCLLVGAPFLERYP